jgi:hypothetical protein
LPGAGDGNRTRTISLGSDRSGASDRPDLRTRCTASDRHRPCDTGANGPSMARRSCLLTEPRQQVEVLHVREDGVVRDERNLQPDCRRGYPTIRLMLLLAQAVPGPDTPGTKRGICLRQVRSWPHDLCPGYLALQAPESVRAPTSQPGPILKFGNGNEGDDRWPTFEYRPVTRCQ